MQVDDTDRYVWLAEEKQLIRDVLDAGKRVLGIGLGGQLLAEALGARIEPMKRPEIGWWPLEKYDESRESPLGRMLPHRLMALHWHTHHFGLPEGAIPLYRSAACGEQGFVWQERAVALQCHMNSTPRSVEALLSHAGTELKRDSTVQDAPSNPSEPRPVPLPGHALLSPARLPQRPPRAARLSRARRPGTSREASASLAKTPLPRSQPHDPVRSATTRRERSAGRQL